MTKESRLTYLIRKGEELKEKDDLAFGAMPVSREEVAEEIVPLEAFTEAMRDNKSSQELTSDEL